LAEAQSCLKHPPGGEIKSKFEKRAQRTRLQNVCPARVKGHDRKRGRQIVRREQLWSNCQKAAGHSS